MWLALSLILTLWDGQHEQWTQQPSSNVVAIPAKPIYAVFLTEPVSDPLGSLTCTFTVSGEEGFVYRGQGSWNNCGEPPKARFFFTSSTNVYSVPFAGTHPHQFWWSWDTWAQVKNGTHTISVDMVPEHFSNALGCLATNCPEGFNQGLEQVERVGIALSGCYFDLGIAVTNGTASISILDFRQNPAINQDEQPVNE